VYGGPGGEWEQGGQQRCVRGKVMVWRTTRASRTPGASDVYAPNEAACQRPRTEAYGLSNRRRGIDALDALSILHRRLFAKRRQNQIEIRRRHDAHS